MKSTTKSLKQSFAPKSNVQCPSLHLIKYSRVNHVMQMASSMARVGLSVGRPELSSGPCNAGRVLMTIEMVEMVMNNSDTMDTTLAPSEVCGFSIRSQRNCW